MKIDSPPNQHTQNTTVEPAQNRTPRNFPWFGESHSQSNLFGGNDVDGNSSFTTSTTSPTHYLPDSRKQRASDPTSGLAPLEEYLEIPNYLGLAPEEPLEITSTSSSPDSNGLTDALSYSDDDPLSTAETSASSFNLDNNPDASGHYNPIETSEENTKRARMITEMNTKMFKGMNE